MNQCVVVRQKIKWTRNDSHSDRINNSLILTFLTTKQKQNMTFAVFPILGFIILTNGNYVKETELGCQGKVYWNFGKSISNVVDNASDKVSCKLACNNNVNCDAWGINISNNECNAFRFIDGGFVYNCEVNNAVEYEGGVKECLTNDKLTSSRIVGLNGDKIAGKFNFDSKTLCFKKTSFIEGTLYWQYM